MLRYFFCFLFFIVFSDAIGQSPKCGYIHLRNEFIKRGYSIHNDTIPSIALKNTEDYGTIPVVFHVVLKQSQLNQLGGEAGLKQFVILQLENLNRDYNALNPDSVLIPQAFKPLYAKVGLKFALAHTKYDGSFTEGIELRITDKTGFELDGFYGSRVGFSDAKYAVGGGLDSWDPATYLNIWIINPLEMGSSTNILGLTISPDFAVYYDLPDKELGITLHYRAWNTLLNFHGRTLTHEMGHYFGLRHTWGDDEGKCAFNGGEDDGIADTPPQAYPTYRCPDFPVTDNCSPDSPGVMYMNFMDYTDDNCQLMFTKGQSARMKASFMLFGNTYSLTQHPEVLQYPVTSDNNTFAIYPNPSSGRLNLRFTRTPLGLEYIYVTSIFGQLVQAVKVEEQRGLYLLDLSNAASGVYFIRLKFDTHTEIEKIVLSKN